MPSVPFSGQSAVDTDAKFANTSRLLNCFLEPSENKVMLKPVLGSEDFVDLSDVFLRDMKEVNGSIYAACGGTLYKITSAGGISVMGTIVDGETEISSNNGVVTVAAGGEYYCLDGETLSQPSGADFDAVGSVTFLGQFTILSELDGRKVAWSAVADPTSLTALDFATAEGRDDNNLRVMAINGNLVIFKETSREIWYQTGADDSASAFQRLAGGVIDTGLKSRGLLVKLDQGAFFIGDDGIAYITDGISQKPVSNRAVETAIKAGAPTRCFYYEDEGHKFACIAFDDRPAWCLNLSTVGSGLEWHERRLGTLRNWPIVSSVKLGADWYVGTDLGNISKLSRVNADGVDPLIKTAVSKTLYVDGKRTRLAELEFEASVGYSDASCWLRLSKDNGNTWGEQKTKEISQTGKYALRANWRSLGQYRRVTIELNWSSDLTFKNSARVRLA